jgi:ATP-dependent Lhr-like helicase
VLDGLAGFELPAELAEREVLARRLRGYQPGWLDRAISDGEWAFSLTPAGAAGRARVAFWPRADLAPAPPPALDPATPTGKVLAQLVARGASFFSDLWHTTGLEASVLAAALSELLVAGVVTNDRFDPVRRGPRPTVPSGRGARVPLNSDRGGRWSLAGRAPADVAWWAERLLDRYGIVGHEHVDAERPPVGWRDLYAVWSELELRGRVRRGYFVDGLSGAQFARPEAVEALRASAAPSTVALSACDPACAWGAILPFAVSRLPSSFVVLDAGRPALVLEAAARRLRSLVDGDALARAVAALATIGGVVEVAEIDGAPAPSSPLGPALRAGGFEPDGERLRRSPLAVRPVEEQPVLESDGK